MQHSIVPSSKQRRSFFALLKKIETLHAPSARQDEACGPCGVAHGNNLLTSSLDKAKEAP